jgi:hypothetical protein
VPDIEEWRRRPAVVRMLRWDGSNEAQLDEFTVGGFRVIRPGDRDAAPGITAEVWDKLHSTWVGAKTGQFVVCGVLGEFYPLDETARAASYDPAETGPCAHTLLLERAGKALAVLGAMKAEWLCEQCQTIHPHQKGDLISVACPDCAAHMTPTSPLLRDLQTERSRREGAEGKLAEAVLMLGAIRETAVAFLGQYGESGIPMFKVGQDLANGVLKIIDGGKPATEGGRS